ncbi:hypothetical protein DFH09DRAFT_1085660 [Mycena vulgaris]|nr:hypothetical protein DFH09DRAFT_1085660 [Mycena vulgaris]
MKLRSRAALVLVKLHAAHSLTSCGGVSAAWTRGVLVAPERGADEAGVKIYTSLGVPVEAFETRETRESRRNGLWADIRVRRKHARAEQDLRDAGHDDDNSPAGSA